ncbi:hypothetical protein HWV62_25134 [Athelia sp. TMB]|nr:hypothetical protein HWV62_25134 [Athelia sp. TMB]
MVRILGGALLVAAQLVRPLNLGLYIAASILQLAGLSPLLLATLGFVRTVVFSALQENAGLTRLFRLLYLLSIAAFVISIYGGSEATSDSPSTLKTSTTLRHVGSILFAVLYVLLVIVHGICWRMVDQLMMHRKTLLTSISMALPFLGVRMVYSILSTYSGSPIPGPITSESSLYKFNTSNGTWWIYLLMGLIMEYVAVCIYTFVGLRIPKLAQRDEEDLGKLESY